MSRTRHILFLSIQIDTMTFVGNKELAFSLMMSSLTSLNVAAPGRGRTNAADQGS
jgi:hypothetical protein